MPAVAERSASTRAVALTVREAGEEDLPAILALVRKALGAGSVPREAAFWRWKHEESTFGRSPALVAYSGERIVGLRVFLRWNLRLGSQRIPAVRAVDTATDPAFQGQGIFRRLTLEMVERLEREGVRLVFNTPNAKSGAGYLRMGWQDVGRRMVWMRGGAWPWSTVRGVGGAGTQGAGELERPELAKLLADAEPGGSTSGLVPAGRGKCAEDSSAAANRLGLGSVLTTGRARGSVGRLRTARSVEFLRWRYVSPPGIAYSIRWEGRYPECALVVTRRARRRGLEELRVAEVVATPHHGSIGAAARALRKTFASSGGFHVATACAAWGTPEARALTLAGFVPAPRIGPRLMVRRLGSWDETSPNPRHAGSWHLSAGDLELF